MRQPARIGGMNSVWGFLWPCGSDFLIHPSPPYSHYHQACCYPASSRRPAFHQLFRRHTPPPPSALPPAASPSAPAAPLLIQIPIFVSARHQRHAAAALAQLHCQRGNGLLGMGWSIGGLSVIHRCGATIAIDGIKGGVNYDANDKFCLDGERLISHMVAVEYRTQHESWQKVMAIGGTASNPSSFTVTSKDGTVQYYGATTDSRIAERLM